MASEKIIKQKEEEVKKLAEKMKDASLVLLVDYRGINVADVTGLRAELRKSNSEYRVIKNNITRRALAECGLEGLDEQLEGPTAVVIGTEEYTTGPKIAHDFAKTHEFYQFKAGIMDGKAVSVDQVKKLASLPSKEVLLTQLASALIGNIRNLAVVLDQVAKKNEESVSA